MDNPTERYNQVMQRARLRELGAAAAAGLIALALGVGLALGADRQLQIEHANAIAQLDKGLPQ